MSSGERLVDAAKKGKQSDTEALCHPPPPPCPGMHEKGRHLRRQPQKRFDRRLEEVAKAVGGGYCRLQMPLKLALGVRETLSGHRLGALEGGLPPFQCIPAPAPCMGFLTLLGVQQIVDAEEGSKFLDLLRFLQFCLESAC